MATLAELKSDLQAGRAVRRSTYPAGRLVWDRGDGLLITRSSANSDTAKPFSLEEIFADDWHAVDVPMVWVRRRRITIRTLLNTPVREEHAKEPV